MKRSAPGKEVKSEKLCIVPKRIGHPLLVLNLNSVMQKCAVIQQLFLELIFGQRLCVAGDPVGGTTWICVESIWESDVINVHGT